MIAVDWKASFTATHTSTCTLLSVQRPVENPAAMCYKVPNGSGVVFVHLLVLVPS